MRGGMVTAVLCPGPSLRGFLAQPAGADTYIGVNHAAEDFACHYWAASDWQAIAAYTPMTRPAHGADRVIPTIFTGRRAWEATAGVRVPGAETRAPKPETRVLLHEECRTACPTDREWKRFTVTAALVLAEMIGSTQIRIYGCDQQGGDYFKPGIHPTAEHFADRWAAEKAAYSRVLGWLKERKVHVERCFVD